MRWMEKMFHFEGEAFKDHSGRVSLGRGAIAFLVLALVIFSFAGLLCSGWIDPARGKSMLSFYQAGLTGLVTGVTTVAGFVYGGKAHAQAAEAKATVTATATVTTASATTTTTPAMGQPINPHAALSASPSPPTEAKTPPGGGV